MTSTTTAAEPRRRGHQRVVGGLTVTTWMILLSLLVHAAVLAIAWQTGFLDNRIIFDRTEEEARTREVEQREAARREQEDRERAEKRLPEEHARKLQQEAEARSRRDLVRKIEEMRRAHEEVRAIRARKLAEIEHRPEAMYRRHLVERVLEEAEQLQREARELAEVTALEPAHQTEQRSGVTMREARQYQQKLTEQLARPVSAEDAAQAADQAKRADVLAKAAAEAAAHAAEALEQAMPGDRPLAQRMAERAARVAEQARQLAGEDLDTTSFNDTAAAREEHGPPPEALADLESRPPAELYEVATRLEAAVHATAADARAAELAMQQNTSLPEAKGKLAQSGPPARAELAGTLTEPELGTVAALNEYREALASATAEAERMRLSSQAQLAQAAALDPGASAMTRQAIESRYAQMLALQRAVAGGAGGGFADVSGHLAAMWQMGHGGSGGDSAIHQLDYASDAGGSAQAGRREVETIRIDQREVSAQALPGRKFDRDSARKGWLYLDTWYVIGPWENHGDLGFGQTHPPEYEINFDAAYTGKVIDGKPLTLRWQFTQGDMIRITPPMERNNSTYYAYTELYFEDDMEMLLALATDDAAQLWINGTQVWNDEGLSAYRIGEHLRKVFFRRGYNQVLVRIENGPAYCQFSVVICPLGSAGAGGG